MNGESASMVWRPWDRGRLKNIMLYPRYSPIRGNLACSAASSFYMVSVFTVTPWFYTVVRYDILYFNVRSKPT